MIPALHFGIMYLKPTYTHHLCIQCLQMSAFAATQYFPYYLNMESGDYCVHAYFELTVMSVI